MEIFFKSRKKAMKYFKNHVEYNAGVHMLGGVGLGILIASPLANPHPVRWGISFLILSLLGHLYTITTKK